MGEVTPFQPTFNRLWFEAFLRKRYPAAADGTITINVRELAEALRKYVGHEQEIGSSPHVELRGTMAEYVIVDDPHAIHPGMSVDEAAGAFRRMAEAFAPAQFEVQNCRCQLVDALPPLCTNETCGHEAPIQPWRLPMLIWRRQTPWHGTPAGELYFPELVALRGVDADHWYCQLCGKDYGEVGAHVEETVYVEFRSGWRWGRIVFAVLAISLSLWQIGELLWSLL